MSSELAIRSNCNYTEKAWHLASILLFLRRPASTIELAERCSLFRLSPKLVRFLCSMPNSPICLSANNFVMLSMSMFSAFGEFLASSMPKVEFRIFGGERMLRSGDDLVYSRKRKKLGNEMMPVVKRRAVLRSVDENERETTNPIATQKIARTCLKGIDLNIAHPDRALNHLIYNRFLKAVNLVNNGDMVVTPSVMNSGIGLLDYQLKIEEDQDRRNNEKTNNVNDMVKFVMEEYLDICYGNETFLDAPTYHGEISRALLSEKIAEFSAVLEETNNEPANLMGGMTIERPPRVEHNQPGEKLSLESTAVINASNNLSNIQMQETKLEYMSEQPLVDNASPEERVESISFGSCSKNFTSVDKLCQANMEIPGDRTHTLNEELTKIKPTSLPAVYADPHFSAQKSRRRSLELKNVPQGELTKNQQTPCKLIQDKTIDIIHKERKNQIHEKAVISMDKSKHIGKNNVSIQERCDNVHKPSKDQQEQRFPEFEAYTVEQEEGSGGYGTVYRARRKTDGLTFAIKCPHANAQRHHVKNELKMLQRFGGRNYVINLECSLKSENSDCFVLQHVDHDRPEVLKKEIDISQLQRYGYCMFKALVGLHKQGVFHRDIKPGNFLFSSKTLYGYLIDFNLAKDLYQKQGNIEKLQPKGAIAAQQNPSVHSKSTSPDKRKKNQGAKFSSFKEAAISGSHRVLESKMLKRKAVDKLKAYEDLGRCNSLTSQGADGSGITSTKDMTSTRTPSVERYRDRQPLPCKGRKALINLAQEAMQNPNLGALKAPASNRKRVAASPGISNRKHIYPTPTPLHSSGIAISGAGTLNNRGDVKPIKDGPCVGTKGFRAPEVLLRSLHQGPKIDVWSAGVTLLYLISGKMPFNGDPEQNMKDIVNLKGNEELWEVAKLHNRESSLPEELLDIGFLPSMTIRDWYKTNTRRPDLLDVIPDSLFDLLEKCLTVNPRLRISAQEALDHEFFVPCHEVTHKRRLLKRDQILDSKSTLLPLLSESVRLLREKLVDPVNF